MTRRLTRDTRSAVLGGVAAGFGRYLDVDPVLVRLAFVLTTLMGGLGIVFYVACWVIVPRDDSPAAARASADAAPSEPPLERMAAEVRHAGDSVRRSVSDGGGARLVVGSFLVILGAVLLLDELHWIHRPHWVRLATLWPMILIALGVALVLRSSRERAE